jgi:hypothetical protein
MGRFSCRSVLIFAYALAIEDEKKEEAKLNLNGLH